MKKFMLPHETISSSAMAEQSQNAFALMFNEVSINGKVSLHERKLTRIRIPNDIYQYLLNH